MSVLIWVQTVCKGYQQTTYIAVSNERVGGSANEDGNQWQIYDLVTDHL